MANENLHEAAVQNLPSKGIELSLKTGTVGDNLAASFRYFKDIIVNNWKLILGSFAVLALVYVAGAVFIRKTELWEIFITGFRSAFDSGELGVDDTGADFLNKFMVLYQEITITSYFFFLLLPFLYPVIYYIFHRLFRESEAFSGLAIRGFWSWLFWQLLTLMLGGIMFMLLIAISIGIISLLSGLYISKASAVIPSDGTKTFEITLQRPLDYSETWNIRLLAVSCG